MKSTGTTLDLLFRPHQKFSLLIISATLETRPLVHDICETQISDQSRISSSAFDRNACDLQYIKPISFQQIEPTSACFALKSSCLRSFKMGRLGNGCNAWDELQGLNTRLAQAGCTLISMPTTWSYGWFTSCQFTQVAVPTSFCSAT